MAKTVIGSGISFDGEISGDDPLVVQGVVKGRVSLDQVTVDAEGSLEADIDVRYIEVLGQVVGNIAAQERVDIRSDGRVTGDIKAPRIQIAEGARFKGHIDME